MLPLSGRTATCVSEQRDKDQKTFRNSPGYSISISTTQLKPLLVNTAKHWHTCLASNCSNNPESSFTPMSRQPSFFQQALRNLDALSARISTFTIGLSSNMTVRAKDGALTTRNGPAQFTLAFTYSQHCFSREVELHWHMVEWRLIPPRCE
jgi:hypothetical protein